MPLSSAEYHMLAAFRYTLRQFLAFSERVAAEVGLTQQQYQALLAVRAATGSEPITISDLAAHMLIKHHSAVGMVNRLEELGMVRRHALAEDRRKVGIRLTARGKRVFQKLATLHRSELRRIGPELGRVMDYFARESAAPARARRRPRARGKAS